jgi:hypothetical protein
MKRDVSVEQLRRSICRWRALALSALTVLIAAGPLLAAERAQAERGRCEAVAADIDLLASSPPCEVLVEAPRAY